MISITIHILLYSYILVHVILILSYYVLFYWSLKEWKSLVCRSKIHGINKIQKFKFKQKMWKYKEIYSKKIIISTTKDKSFICFFRLSYFKQLRMFKDMECHGEVSTKWAVASDVTPKTLSWPFHLRTFTSLC